MNSAKEGFAMGAGVILGGIVAGLILGLITKKLG